MPAERSLRREQRGLNLEVVAPVGADQPFNRGRSMLGRPSHGVFHQSPGAIVHYRHKSSRRLASPAATCCSNSESMTGSLRLSPEIS